MQFWDPHLLKVKAFVMFLALVGRFKFFSTIYGEKCEKC
jgi:hypothetical protein